MKPYDLGFKVTVLEGLAYIVPGTLFLWGVVQLDRIRFGLLPADWPVTALDKAAAGAMAILLGVALQRVGHLLNPLYDTLYKPFYRSASDRSLLKRVADALPEDERTRAHYYHYTKSELTNAGRPIGHVNLAEGQSKLFRALTLGFLIIAGLLFYEDGWRSGTVAALTALVSFLAFGRQRLSSTSEVYRAYLQWREELASKAPDQPRHQASLPTQDPGKGAE